MRAEILSEIESTITQRSYPAMKIISLVVQWLHHNFFKMRGLMAIDYSAYKK